MPSVPPAVPEPAADAIDAAAAAIDEYWSYHDNRPPWLTAEHVVEVAANVRSALAEQLHAARHAAGFTLKQVAAMMPSHPSYPSVQAYCSGARMPPLDTVVELCLVLNADPGAVLAEAVRVARERAQAAAVERGWRVDVAGLIASGPPWASTAQEWFDRRGHGGADVVEMTARDMRELAVVCGQPWEPFRVMLWGFVRADT